MIDFVFFSEPVVISPARWLASCFIPVIIAFYGYKKGSVNLSGALLGILVAFVLTLSNFSFLASLFTFFLSSSKATKFRSHLKKKIEEDFKEGIWFSYSFYSIVFLHWSFMKLYLNVTQVKHRLINKFKLIKIMSWLK